MFYRLSSERAVESWREQAPEGFCFAAKASRLVTHFHRLSNADEAMRNLSHRIEPLGEHLGPRLFQLPPKFPADQPRLQAFLKLLPGAIEPVLEFRDESWWNTETCRVLEHAGAGFAMFDMARPAHPCSQRPTLRTSAFTGRARSTTAATQKTHSATGIESWRGWTALTPRVCTSTTTSVAMPRGMP